MRRLPPLLVLLVAALLLAACAAPAPTPAPTAARTATLRPTATPRPPTPTPTATFTPSPTPDIRLQKTRRLLAAFAASAAETANGFRLTLPSGEKVELQNVAEQNLTMEPQNWVENYNGGKILYEGKTEAGQEWRVVKLETGEIALMYDHTFSYLSDIFPYTLYSLDRELAKSGVGKFKASVIPPGNGEVEGVHLRLNDEGKWVDDSGQEVQLTDATQWWIKRYHLTEMDLQRVTIHNWEVQALVDQDGREWVAKEGKLMADGQKVAMPEVVGEATPTSLAKRAEDGKWYVMDERGLARWVVNEGKVEKYNRPVMAFDYSKDPRYESDYPGLPERMAKLLERVKAGVDYSQMKPVVIGGKEFWGGLVGMEGNLVGFKDGDRMVWVHGLMIDVFDQPNANRNQVWFVVVSPSLFNDQVIEFSVFNDGYGRTITYGMLIDSDWRQAKDEGFLPEKLRQLWEKAGKNLTVVLGGNFWERKGEWEKYEADLREGRGSFKIIQQRLVVIEGGK